MEILFSYSVSLRSIENGVNVADFNHNVTLVNDIYSIAARAVSSELLEKAFCLLHQSLNDRRRRLIKSIHRIGSPLAGATDPLFEQLPLLLRLYFRNGGPFLSWKNPFR